MPWNLQRAHLQRLTDIVKSQSWLDDVGSCRAVLRVALGLTDRAKKVVEDLALKGSPEAAASQILLELNSFGRLEDGEEALELFLTSAVIPKVDIVVGEEIRAIIGNYKNRGQAAGFSWPEPRGPLSWAMADHSSVREAFTRLLARDATWRLLPIRGESETGKSHITKQMQSNALQIPDLACGRFDFKGTTDMDGEVLAFVQDLGVPPPPASPRLNERLGHILVELRQRARPALLIFDTYEAAGEAQDWVEKQLLPGLIRAPWLRVVIAGQRAPRFAGAVWASVACAPLELSNPQPADWFEYGKQHCPDLRLDLVVEVCRLAADKSSMLAQLFGPKM